MLSTVEFSCTALQNMNKAGDIKKTPEGYYPMVVGGLNMCNARGEYYTYEAAKKFFVETSDLMRRVKRSALRGEYGHPRPQPHDTEASFNARLFDIMELNTCCHHKDLWLDFDRVKDPNGNKVIAIMSNVLPSGPLGHVLQAQLDNKHENVCFSIRSFTQNSRQGGRTIKAIQQIVTFDYVNEPGIAIAEKWKSPSLESLYERTLSREDLVSSLTMMDRPNLGMESAKLSGLELMNALGWSMEALTRPQETSFMDW